MDVPRLPLPSQTKSCVSMYESTVAPWQQEQEELCKRLEARLQQEAEKKAAWQQVVAQGRNDMLRLQDLDLRRVLRHDAQLSDHLQSCCAQQQLLASEAQRRQVSQQQASWHQEARSRTRNLQNEQERSRAAEQRFALLQQRQSAAAEAAKSRWLKTAMISIDASGWYSHESSG
eukprot:TRINITY_DN46408_c0_g1_i1.p1 TRINITY_DN46408_c0_g1~~TRINITY_DN46408_c0_g1_i1.p1  ORF type:complete len:174 (+),score=48.09 TRINITY_DN46408_c0_g1_i1:53-574(+)